MQYVNEYLIMRMSSAEHLQEFDRLIPHRSIVGVIVKLLLRNFIEHVLRDVARVGDLDWHWRILTPSPTTLPKLGI
jgi:hypothetical protein